MRAKRVTVTLTMMDAETHGPALASLLGAERVAIYLREMLDLPQAPDGAPDEGYWFTEIRSVEIQDES